MLRGEAMLTHYSPLSFARFGRGNKRRESEEGSVPCDWRGYPTALIHVVHGFGEPAQAVDFEHRSVVERHATVEHAEHLMLIADHEL